LPIYWKTNTKFYIIAGRLNIIKYKMLTRKPGKAFVKQWEKSLAKNKIFLKRMLSQNVRV